MVGQEEKQPRVHSCPSTDKSMGRLKPRQGTKAPPLGFYKNISMSQILL